MDGVHGPPSGGVTKIPVFRPTWEEFKDFNNYIIQIEKTGAHKAGLAKIIPPPEWKPRADGYDMNVIGDIDIPAPISQVVQGKQGVYQQFNIQKNAMKVRDLKKMADNPRYATPPHFDYEDLDRKYWRNISYFPPIYGADVSGSLTDPDVKEWNINKLGSILDYVNEDYGISIDGVNTAYLYFGMWKSSFAWHTEDMDLYSINYLHFGEPKSWYCVPPEHGARLERLANNFFPANYKECPAYLRHKMTVISPMVLKHHSIPYLKIVQEAGEFMITFPYGYHAGFNHGFNCAESTNFASPRWVEYGKRATQCSCRPDMVKISMDTFVKRFQPDRYDLWVQGKDIGPHPEIPGRYSAAPHPSREEIMCNKNNTDLPESFVEPSKKKAKRHLIHKQLEQPGQPEQPPEESAVKQETLEKPQEEEQLTEEELTEQAYEVMKDIYYKAGEMESDGLEECQEECKRKLKKAAKKSKNKSSCNESESNNVEQHLQIIKHRRIKPELRVPSPIAAAVLKTGTTSKLPPVKTTNMFSGFRIPKKVVHSDSSAPEDIMQKETSRIWTEAETNASQLLVNLVGIVKQEANISLTHLPPVLKPQPIEDANSFSKTRIQTPSPSSQLKTCPSLTQRCPSPSSLIKCSSSSSAETFNLCMKPASSPTSANNIPPIAADVRCFVNGDSKPRQLTNVNKLPGTGDERRSRKQKCPRINRSGVDTRDLTATLSNIWHQQKDWTLSNEAEFNLLSSQQEPYCCICSLLRPPVSQRSQPQTTSFSAVLLPDELFGSNPTENASIVLRCSSCRVCVHAKCYGELETVESINWLCRRCERSVENVKCCLCQQRGGALKETSDARWAHIVCTLSFKGVFFGQPALREPIVVDQLSRENVVLLNCVFCSGRPDNSSVFYRGICLPCAGPSAGKQCGRAFHPMCGLVNGVRFSLDQDGQIIGSCCSVSPRPIAKKKTSTPIQVGQQVYAKHPNGKYCLAEVIDNSHNVIYYIVDFIDGTTSKDTYPEDIRNYNCREDGPPPFGAAVDVMWTDGKRYGGHFRGQVQRQIFKLRFHDGDDTVVTAERKEFHHRDEELPKNVRDQLSKQGISIANH